MDVSFFLACLIGPMLTVIGTGMVCNPRPYHDLAQEIMQSPALVFVIGYAALPAGIATLLVHNVWVADWRVTITILGWLGVLGGAFRILMPLKAARTGHRLTANLSLLRGAGSVWLVLGLVLSYCGYLYPVP
jgi:hypothetical protein